MNKENNLANLKIITSDTRNYFNNVFLDENKIYFKSTFKLNEFIKNFETSNYKDRINLSFLNDRLFISLSKEDLLCFIPNYVYENTEGNYTLYLSINFKNKSDNSEKNMSYFNFNLKLKSYCRDFVNKFTDAVKNKNKSVTLYDGSTILAKFFNLDSIENFSIFYRKKDLFKSSNNRQVLCEEDLNLVKESRLNNEEQL